jgi:hypothetical protein
MYKAKLKKKKSTTLNIAGLQHRTKLATKNNNLPSSFVQPDSSQTLA